MRKCIVEDGIVTNVIEVDAGAEYQPPNGDLVKWRKGVSVGHTYKNGEFAAPVVDIDVERAAMVCSAAQFRMALAKAGLMDAFVKFTDDDPEAAIVFEYGTEFRRNSDIMRKCVYSGCATDEQLDDIFRAATAIEV